MTFALRGRHIWVFLAAIGVPALPAAASELIPLVQPLPVAAEPTPADNSAFAIGTESRLGGVTWMESLTGSGSASGYGASNFERVTSRGISSNSISRIGSRTLFNFRIPSGTPETPGQVKRPARKMLGLFDLTTVPEPSTWASMLLGFGLMGGALRRARRSARTTPMFGAC